MGEIDIIALFVAIPVVVLTITFIVVLYEPTTADPEHIQRGDAASVLGIHTRLQWLLTIGLSVLFILTGVHIATGIPEVEAIEAVLSRFGAWGYTEDFRFFIGFTEMLAAILLIPRQTAAWTAGYLSIIMGGSIYTHLAYGSWALALIPLLCLVGLVYLGVSRSPYTERRRLQPQPAS
jgi:hypothetical protein